VSAPVIGVTLGDGDRAGYHSMRADYVRSVERAGAIPLLLPALAPAHAEAVLERLDGVLLSGGIDVDPALYGRPRHPKLGRVDRARDEFELALTRLALERDLPLLAICRGQQVLNVATGGTLLQDLPSELKGTVTHDAPGRRTRRSHSVELAPGSRLSLILGAGPLSVNSFHHQAIDEPGRGVTVTGRSPEDGVIEAVELRDRAFAIGVQWHPESFWRQQAGSFQPLFDAHAEACRVASLVRAR
jgi:putative glutamine amidotransferase